LIIGEDGYISGLGNVDIHKLGCRMREMEHPLSTEW
jgi:hypothetical protein